MSDDNASPNEKWARQAAKDLHGMPINAALLACADELADLRARLADEQPKRIEAERRLSTAAVESDALERWRVRAIEAEADNATLRKHIERRASGNDPLTVELRAKVADLERRERQSHDVTCNHRAEGIGGPGCICQVVNKYMQRDLEAKVAALELYLSTVPEDFGPLITDLELAAMRFANARHDHEPGAVRADDYRKECRAALTEKIAALQFRLDGLKALVGTIRDLVGCERRNVDDVTPEQHSREIMARFNEQASRLDAALKEIEGLKAARTSNEAFGRMAAKVLGDQREAVTGGVVERPLRIVAVPGGPNDRADFYQDGKLVGSIVNIEPPSE